MNTVLTLKNIGVLFFSLLLHAKMKDYPTCTAVVNIWLKNPQNFAKSNYHVVLELYINFVLIPLDRWSEVYLLITTCSGLSVESQEQYTKLLRRLERRIEHVKINNIQQLSSVDIAKSETAYPQNNKERLDTEDALPSNGTGILRIKIFPCTFLRFNIS